MTSPREVVAAAGEMASGSRLERGRAAVRAFRLFTELSTEDKRDLAVLVAQRAAPDLVPRIQAEGPIDLTEEQSQAVLDMVRRLDGDDLRELGEAVATPEARRQALASVGGAAATATGLDDVVDDQDPARNPGAGQTATEPTAADPPAASGPPQVDETTERLRARADALERQLAELHDDLAEAETARREAIAAREQAEQARTEAEEAAKAERDRAEQATQTTEKARADTRAAEDRLRRFRDRADGPDVLDVASPGEPLRRSKRDVASASEQLQRGRRTRSNSIAAEGRATTTTAAEVDDLVARLRNARPSEALRLLVVAAASVAGMDAADRRRTLVAIPDGWARRRGLQRLVEADAIPAAEATDLLATLGSTGAQVFAATSMIDTGLARADDLAEVMEPTAAARLRRRTPA